LEIRSIAEAGNEESTNTDEDSSDDNTYSLYTVGDSSDDEEYLKNAMVYALVAHAVASKAKSDAILAERERFKSMNRNENYSITKVCDCS
jgi:predicted AAA+ superfamily ATPase